MYYRVENSQHGTNLEIFQHPEGFDLLLPEDWSHGLVRGEPLLVLGVHQLVFLEVGPDSLHTLQ